MDTGRTTWFTLGGMTFEYDEEKNRTNIMKHGISLVLQGKLWDSSQATGRAR